MSVYRDTQGAVTFSHPIGTALTATVKDASGVVQYTSDPISPLPDFAADMMAPSQPGIYTFYVPWSLTQYDAKYTVTWSDGNGFSRNSSFEVVTPIVDLSVLQTVFPDVNSQYGDLVNLETTVRTIIDSYCGQTFGYSYGAQTYTGTGTGKLILKQRCDQLIGLLGGYGCLPSDWQQEIFDASGNPVLDNGGNPTYATNLNGELNLDRAALILDGWTFLYQFPEYLDVRETPPMELVEFAPAQDGTIRVPRRYMRERDYGTQYTLTGYWGYQEVPEDVTQAALLLANDYISGDSEYRDRYLQIMKVQQDALTYHPGAFRGTGNARADMLLNPFRKQMGMTIL